MDSSFQYDEDTRLGGGLAERYPIKERIRGREPYMQPETLMQI
jgi:hypothetical protein